MTQPSDVIHDPHYTAAIYHQAEAAHIIAVPAQTFRNWSVRYAYKRLDGSQVVSAPTVTTLQPARPHGVSVPFIGLAGAYIVAAFTKAGLPMQRIRPAVLWLQEHIGLPQALASERLMTDEAEVLWDFGQHSPDPADQDSVEDLVVVRSGRACLLPTRQGRCCFRLASPYSILSGPPMTSGTEPWKSVTPSWPLMPTSCPTGFRRADTRPREILPHSAWFGRPISSSAWRTPGRPR